jgi:Fe-S-cluster-containing dehydrogenase component
MSRPDPNGPVSVEQKRCIGCNACVFACPFGVIGAASGGRPILKCDLCGEMVESGGKPACVSACPTGALRFVLPEKAAETRRQAAAEDTVGGRQTPK